jgi:hypothetical protein
VVGWKREQRLMLFEQRKLAPKISSCPFLFQVMGFWPMRICAFLHSALSATGGRTGLQWSTDAGAQGQVGYELDHGLLELIITARINYTIRSFLTTLFFTNGPVWKHISDLDLLKGAKPVGVLIGLRGAQGFGALPSMSEPVEIEGHQRYLCST